MTTAPAETTATSSTPAPRPEPGQPTARTYRGLTAGDWGIRLVLALVMTAALAVGTWSIYTLLTHQFGAPKAIAMLGCGMFDVAALFFALLSQKYAVTTDSGLAPRTAMLAMICTSSWVNWQHGQLAGWGTVGSVILAAAPVIAELSFEMFHRYAHREALRRLGRVAQSLPVLGKWAWLRHPVRSHRALDAHIKAALTEHEAIAVRREELAVDRARSIVAAPTGPAVDRTALTVDRTAGPDREWTADRGPSAPAVDRTAERTALPAGPDRGPADRATVQEQRTADRPQVDRGPDRAATSNTTPDRTADRTAGPDRTTDGPLALNDTEQAALDLLRSTGRSISKRSIADVVRTELGRSIGSDRAAEIARHYRTLRSAA